MTMALLIVFAFAWRYGGPSSRSARNTAADAATQASNRATTTTTPTVKALTGAGFGRREVEARPWDDLREVTDSVGITLREVPRTLGLVGNAADPDGDAPPRVVRTEPFFIGTTEVTRAQWKKICGPFSDPSIYSGTATTNDALPVNNVDFPEAIRFCRLLSAREGRNYRLPTEYEWEIACWGRRTNEIFATRAAMKFAARVAAPDFGAADDLGREKISKAVAEASIDAADQDMRRLGYDEKKDIGPFALANGAILIVHAQALDALRRSPVPHDPGGRSARVYDAILPTQLGELQHAAYARGADATAARGEFDYEFVDRFLSGTATADDDPSIHYGKYQAAWWKGHDATKPQGHPFGLQDMLGGLMEWTATPTMPYPSTMTLGTASAESVNAIRFDESSIPEYRWAALDELGRFAFNPTLRDKTFYVVRGGSFERAVESCTPWNRYAQLPLRTRLTAHRENLGFRVVLEP